MGILPKLNILASINDISMWFTIPLADKRDQYWKPDFPDNLKKYKTKTIPKNSILFKPKYDFKNKIWRYEDSLLSYLVLEIILWFNIYIYIYIYMEIELLYLVSSQVLKNELIYTDKTCQQKNNYVTLNNLK